MKLHPPRYNPYSVISNAIEKLEEKGYNSKYTIIDEYHLKDENSNVFNASQLNIDELLRFDNPENKSGKTMIVALNTNNGEKGVLITTYGEDGDEVVNNFLRNVDKEDGIHQQY